MFQGDTILATVLASWPSWMTVPVLDRPLGEYVPPHHTLRLLLSLQGCFLAHADTLQLLECQPQRLRAISKVSLCPFIFTFSLSWGVAPEEELRISNWRDATYNTLSCAPFGETFHRGPVWIIKCNIGYNDTHGLNVLRIFSVSIPPWDMA